MASKSNWAMDSIVLKFVTAPFKSAWILFLIVLIIFCSSLVLQTYFHRPSLLQLELANTRDWSYCQIWCMAFRPLSLLIARLPACHS